MIKKHLLISVLLSFFLLISFQNDLFATGESGAQFLKIGVGARACAMGEAFVGLADDPTTIYWNPAGLSQINSLEILGMQNFWLLDMSYQHAAFVIPTIIGHFGVSVSYSSSGNIPRYENFINTGEYSAYDLAGTIAFSAEIKSLISTGVGVKIINQKIEEESALGFAIDAGLLYKVTFLEGLKLGLSIQNLGPSITFIDEGDPLPMNIKAGAALIKSPFTLAMDLNKPNDNKMHANIGGEFLLKSILALRTGYNSANSYTAGAGITWHKISADYAFTPFKEIDNSHRISIRIKFI